MMQFTVPQFIDVEDKIIGPITTRQFLISLVGCVLTAVGYKLFDFSGFIAWTLLMFCIHGTIAFLKINGMPFHFFILNFFQTTKKPKLRVWNKLAPEFISKKDLETPDATVEEIVVPRKKPATSSRLAELSLIVDTLGEYEGERKRNEVEIKPKNKLVKDMDI